MSIPYDFEEMYFELLSFNLEVVLIPAPEPKHATHCIRVAQSRNPLWYRRFCQQYGSSRRKPKRSRKFDTRIKRQHTLKALENILDGKTSGIYIERLIEFANQERVRQQRNQVAISSFETTEKLYF